MTKKILFYFLLIFSCQSLYANNDVFVYLLKYTKSNGKEVVVYCGITNNPAQRALEHADDRTMGYNTFDTMLVIAGPMSRERALRQETDCIYRYPIPRLYQTYPNDQIRPSDLDKNARAAAIDEYESHTDTSRLSQTPDPLVVYASEVRERLQCENCGRAVTDGVINFSHLHFGSHVLCMGCQPRAQSISSASSTISPISLSSSDSNSSLSSEMQSNSTSDNSLCHDDSDLEVPSAKRREIDRTCDDCGRSVTDGIRKYSLQHFAGQIFCMSCQRHHK